MIVLLDTDVLIDVALDRKPFSEHSSIVLDEAERYSFRSFIAWHSIANFYYIVSSSAGDTEARDFITDLLRFVNIAPTNTKDCVYATSLDIADFEDALQIAAARSCSAEIIVTRNVKHYTKSHIPALTPDDFLKKISNYSAH